MTPKQKYARKTLLKEIHLNPNYKEIKAAGAWEDYLTIRFGVTSSAELSITELNQLYGVLHGLESDELNRKPDWRGRAIIKQEASLIKGGKATQKQINAINSIWEQKSREKSHESLMQTIKRLTGNLYLHVHMLTKEEATHVITILSNDKKFK
ncbi:MAG: hypothetical protein RL154_1552 [Pseudomonadota bacterium]|jgi:hypothetical protein